MTCCTRSFHLLRKRNLFLLHCIEQKMMEVALCTNGGHRLLQCGTRIDQCRRIFPKAVVGIGEIAAVSELQTTLFNAPLHQGEISLMFRADTPRGVTHMANGKRSGFMIENGFSVRLTQCFVHPPLIKEPAPHAQEADMRCAPRLTVARILIDVHNRQEYGIHMRQDHIHHSKIGTHFARGKERLICIEDDGPVTAYSPDCGIPCSGEVILPREINDIPPCLFSKCTRPIRRSCVDNNSFIGIDCSI